MASGCTNSGGNAAVLFQKLTPDTQVQYTGTAYPQFGICKGDLLSEVENSILTQIDAFAQGHNISLTEIDLTECECFTSKVGCCGAESCQTLVCILEAYLECLCDLYADMQTVKTELAAVYDGPYDTACLSGVTSASKLPAIVQEIITELCAAEANITTLTTAVTAISTNLTTNIGNFMNTAILSCQTGSLVKAGSGASFTATFKGFTPIGGIVMYGGPIAGIFDPTGLGISPGPACGWALCNGAIQNGITTIDMRGYFPTGVNDGTMGTAAQNAEVTNSTNPGQAYPLNGRVDTSTGLPGEIKHLLSAAESGTGAHTHAVVDPMHSHVMSVNLDSASGANNANFMKIDATSFNTTPDGVPDIGNIHAKVRAAATGISIGAATAAGASTSHENRPPFRAVYFIQRVA